MAVNPHVVISIPVYNGGPFIRQAVTSALSQDYEPLTVLVIDNASIDDTPSILAEFDDSRLSVRRFEEFLRVAGNWNRAIQEAGGDLLLLLSADNALLPGAVSALAGALAANPSCGMAIGRVEYVVTPGHVRDLGRPVRAPEAGVIKDVEKHLLRYGNNFTTESVMFRRSLPGMYMDPEMKNGCDLDMILRVGQVGVRAISLDRPVVQFLEHPDALSSKENDKVWESMIGVYTRVDPPAPLRRAYKDRIGRMLTWECMLLVRRGDGAIARERVRMYGPKTSLMWRGLIQTMLVVPGAHRIPNVVRRLLSSAAPRRPMS